MATNKLISKLVKKIDENKDAGIALFSKKNLFKPEAVWAHFDVPEADFNLGTLGFPVGLTEIYGASKSGKTTVALAGMKWFQKKYPDGVCIILSSEQRDNKEYALEMGVDIDNVIIIPSKYVEDLFLKFIIQLDEINTIFKEEKLPGKPKVYVMWDSIGATLSRSEVSALTENVSIMKKNMQNGTKLDMKHANPGSFAKNAKMMMKAVLGRLYEDEIVMVAINHVIDDFETNKKISTGGGWREFLPTMRLYIKHKKLLQLGEKAYDGKEIKVDVGQVSMINVEKNDFGSRYPTELHILFGVGIMLNDTDIQYAIDKKILKQEGKSKISFMGKLSWTTPRTYYQNYIDHHPLLPVLHKRLAELRHKDVLASKSKNEDDEE